MKLQESEMRSTDADVKNPLIGGLQPCPNEHSGIWCYSLSLSFPLSLSYLVSYTIITSHFSGQYVDNIDALWFWLILI